MADEIEDFLNKIRLGGIAPKAQKQSIDTILQDIGILKPAKAGKTIISAIQSDLATNAEVSSNPETGAFAPAQPVMRQDGSIAARFNPEVNVPGPMGEVAKAQNIEFKAMRAFDIAKERGYQTVSSGYDARRNQGWVIAEDKDGKLIRIEAEPDYADEDGGKMIEAAKAQPFPEPSPMPTDLPALPYYDEDGAKMLAAAGAPLVPAGAPPVVGATLENAILDRLLYRKEIPSALRRKDVDAAEYDFSPIGLESERRIIIDMRNKNVPFNEIMTKLRKIQQLPIPIRQEIERMQAAGLPLKDIYKAYESMLIDVELANSKGSEGVKTYYDPDTKVKYEHKPSWLAGPPTTLVMPEPLFQRAPGATVLQFAEQPLDKKIEELTKAEPDPTVFINNPKAKSIFQGLIAKRAQAEEAAHQAILNSEYFGSPFKHLSAVGWEGFGTLVTSIGRAGAGFWRGATIGVLDFDQLRRLAGGTDLAAAAMVEQAGPVAQIAEVAGETYGMLMPFAAAGKAIGAGAQALGKLALPFELAGGGAGVGPALLGATGAAARTSAAALELMKGPLSFATVNVGQRFVQNAKAGLSPTEHINDAAMSGIMDGITLGLLQVANKWIAKGIPSPVAQRTVESILTGIEFTGLKDPEMLSDPVFLAGSLPVFGLMGMLSKAPDFSIKIRRDLFESTPSLRAAISARVKATGAKSAAEIDKISQEEFARLLNIFRNPNAHSPSDVVLAKTVFNEMFNSQLGTAGVPPLNPNRTAAKTFSDGLFAMFGKMTKATIGDDTAKLLSSYLLSARARAGDEFATLIREGRASPRALANETTAATVNTWDKILTGKNPNQVQAMFIEGRTTGKINVGTTTDEYLDVSKAPPLFESLLSASTKGLEPKVAERVAKDLRDMYLAKRMGIEWSPELPIPQEAQKLYSILGDRTAGIDQVNRRLATHLSEVKVADALTRQIAGDEKAERQKIEDKLKKEVVDYDIWIDDAKKILQLPQLVNETDQAKKYDLFAKLMLGGKTPEQMPQTIITPKEPFIPGLEPRLTDDYLRAIYRVAGGATDPLGAGLYTVNYQLGPNGSMKLMPEPLIIDKAAADKFLRTERSKLSPENQLLYDAIKNNYTEVGSGVAGGGLKDKLVRRDIALDITGLESGPENFLTALGRWFRTAKVGLSPNGAARDSAGNVKYLYYDFGSGPSLARAVGSQFTGIDTLPSGFGILKLRNQITEPMLTANGAAIDDVISIMSTKPNAYKIKEFQSILKDNPQLGLSSKQLFESMAKSSPKTTQDYLKRFGNQADAEAALFRDIALSRHLATTGTSGTSFAEVELDKFAKARQTIRISDYLDIEISTMEAVAQKILQVPDGVNRIPTKQVVKWLEESGGPAFNALSADRKLTVARNLQLYLQDGQAISAYQAMFVETGDAVKRSLAEKTGVQKASQALINLRKYPDDLTKIGAYFEHLRRGVSMTDAAERIGKRYPNYDNIPRGVATTGRYFGNIGANFFYEDMRISYETMRNTPWRFAIANFAFPLAASMIAQTIGNISDDEMKTLRQKYGWHVSPLPGKDETGNRIIWDPSSIYNTMPWIVATRFPDQPSPLFGPPGPLNTYREFEGVAPHTLDAQVMTRVRPFTDPFLTDAFLADVYRIIEGVDQYGRPMDMGERIAEIGKMAIPAVVDDLSRALTGGKGVVDAITGKRPAFGVEPSPSEQITARVGRVPVPVLPLTGTFKGTNYMRDYQALASRHEKINQEYNKYVKDKMKDVPPDILTAYFKNPNKVPPEVQQIVDSANEKYMPILDKLTKRLQSLSKLIPGMATQYETK